MDSRRVPLTRNPRYARIPASPRKRGEAKDRGWIESENDITRETPMKRSWMDRIIDTIEWIAAGFVGIVALDIFLSVLLRNTLNYSIPDSFDIGRMLLGILIFWGIAATSYRGTHITVDLVWGNVGPRYQRWIDVFATLVLLFVVTVQTWTLFDKVRGTYNDNVQTFDMHMPTWPFFAVAWIGDAAAVLLIAIRTYRLIFHPKTCTIPN
ncbi:TRAP-type C4-dicarboxylate transport system permease small subunit [Bradyrhizobium japonicum]